MKKTKIFTTIAITSFIFTSYNAYSQELSANPWAEQNSKEAIENVYKQRRKAKYGYNPNIQDDTLVDTSSSYKAETPEEESFLDNIKDFFEEDDNNTAQASPNINQQDALINQRRRSLQSKNISRPRQAKSQALPQSENNDSSFFSFFKKKEEPKEEPKRKQRIRGSSGKKKSLIPTPSFDANRIIRKLERASGFDLKAIGRKLK